MGGLNPSANGGFLGLSGAVCEFFCNARDANVSLGGCVQSNVVVYQQLCRMFAAEGG